MDDLIEIELCTTNIERYIACPHCRKKNDLQNAMELFIFKRAHRKALLGNPIELEDYYKCGGKERGGDEENILEMVDDIHFRLRCIFCKEWFNASNSTVKKQSARVFSQHSCVCKRAFDFNYSADCGHIGIATIFKIPYVKCPDCEVVTLLKPRNGLFYFLIYNASIKISRSLCLLYAKTRPRPAK